MAFDSITASKDMFQGKKFIKKGFTASMKLAVNFLCCVTKNVCHIYNVVATNL